jgi:hypothetical protein
MSEVARNARLDDTCLERFQGGRLQLQERSSVVKWFCLHKEASNLRDA